MALVDHSIAGTASSSASTFVNGADAGGTVAAEVASLRSMRATLNGDSSDVEKHGIKDESDIIWVDWDGPE